jgi:acetyltransferase-like isoleucine patch superfamily enzyme
VKIGGGMHPMEWVSTSPVFYKGRDSVKAKFSEFEREPNQIVRIGNDVWIGEGVLIKQGVTIGNGAVIGMGSIVTKDIEPYTIYAGSPARKIRNRFEENVITELNQLKWWDLAESDLKKVSPYIQNPIEFISRLKSLLNK